MSPMQQYLWIMARGHLAKARDDERGVSAVEWIIITLALIGMATAVVFIIRGRIEQEAATINF